MAICLRWFKSSSAQKFAAPWIWYNQFVLQKYPNPISRNKEKESIFFALFIYIYIFLIRFDLSKDLDWWSLSIKKEKESLKNGLYIVGNNQWLLIIYSQPCWYQYIIHVSFTTQQKEYFYETNPMYVIIDLTGIVVQSVRAPPCQGGSCGFEPRQSRTRTINSSLYSLWKRGRHQDLIPSRWGIFFLLLFVSYLSSDKSSIDWWGGNIGGLVQVAVLLY